MLVTWDFLINYSREIPLPSDVRSQESIDKYTQEFKTKTSEEKNEIIYKRYLRNNLNLHKNKYPYNLENGIEHYVLWVKPETQHLFTDDLIYIYIKIKTELMGFKEFVYFENHNDSKSILNIKHYQVFVR